MLTAFDAAQMARALALAARGRYACRPNPVVGCVLTREGRVLAEGFHARAGEAHAEISALAALAPGQTACGATCYVTLEPCAHHGRTGPCAEALVEAGVARVVYAVTDPNPLVAGGGLARLAAAGVTVDGPLMAPQAMALNAGFFMRMRAGRPRVVAKVALSLDGAMALADGQSQWITGPAARADGQRLRAQAGAIITGIGTVMADDPALTVRDPRFVDQIPSPPLRVVLDRRLRLSPAARIAMTGDAPTRVFVSSLHSDPQGAAQAALEARGVQVSRLPALTPAGVLQALGEAQINDVLLEAGPTLTAAFLDAGMIDELVVYRSGCLLGAGALPGLVPAAPSDLAAANRYRLLDCRWVGSDLRTRYLPPAEQDAEVRRGL